MTLNFITPAVSLNCPKLWKDFPAGEVRSAKLTVTGLGLYRAFLNGRRVGDDYLTPGFNDYDAYLRCQTYDVTELLSEENHLEVWLGNGWYKGRIGYDGGQENTWGDRYLLGARLEMTLSDGTVHTLETDETWLASLSPVVSGNIYDGEVYDDTRDPGENVPCVPAAHSFHLVAPFSPAVRVKAVLKPQLIHTPAGEQVLDFGQNMAGIIRFVNRLPRGGRLRLQTGEVLQQGNFYRDNLRTAGSEFVYTSDGTEKEIEPLFTFFGFRYVKVEGIGHVDPDDFTALCLSSALEETLEVHTSHEKLNQLMRNSLWGQRSNFLDVPTDCPQRDERLGWTADTQVFVNTACYQMDCRDFYRKFMRDMREDQVRYYDGNIPAYSPSLKKLAIPGGAVWADAGAIIPWNVYLQYGDTELLRENWPMIRDYAEWLIRADEAEGGSHLVFSSFTFGDWLAQDGLTPQSLKGGTPDAWIQGVYYYNSIHIAAMAAEVLGLTEEQAKYAGLADGIRNALLDEYVSPNGNLTVDTQTGYVLALCYGIFRDREKLLRGFRARLRRDFYKITCGFTGAPLILPVLLDNGLVDDAYRMLLTEEFPGWLYAVNLGATTVWERWNSLKPDGTISGTGMNSLNHYAYGSVCEAVYSRIMGLRNAAPGWKKALIAPKINARIRNASIRFRSPAGEWFVSWEIPEDGRIVLKAEVPEGTEAHVILPYHPGNPEEDVPAGSHVWEWQPTADLLHPFSLQTLLGDLMNHAGAAAALRQAYPAMYAACEPEGSELRVLAPPAAIAALHGNPELLPALEEALRKVHV